MALKWPDKDPEEELDYPVDFSQWVVQGNTIDSAACVIESVDGDDSANPLVVDTVNFASDIVNVWLTGGVVGVKYTFKVTVTDDNVSPFDRQGVRRVTLKIKAK